MNGMDDHCESFAVNLGHDLKNIVFWEKTKNFESTYFSFLLLEMFAIVLAFLLYGSIFVSADEISHTVSHLKK